LQYICTKDKISRPVGHSLPYFIDVIGSRKQKGLGYALNHQKKKYSPEIRRTFRQLEKEGIEQPT